MSPPDTEPSPAPPRARSDAWTAAACAAAVAWSALVSASPAGFFRWATPLAALWLALSAAARPPARPGAARRWLPDAALGLGSGLALYAAARLFLWASCGPLSQALCPPLHDLFARFQPQAPGPGLALALIIAPAEELFWRGLAQPRLARRLGSAGGVAAATALAVALALATREPFLALAMACTYPVWGALAAWRGGPLVAMVSHALWSVLIATLAAPG
ncbi:MAG: CPBP family intramembrane metalloprotease [Anaeromyxobacter sp.]